jgi:hypothetical protein
MFNTFFPENHAFREIMWKNMLQPDKPQVKIRRMRFASFITKATDTHSEYIIFIAFPLEQLLRERASILRLYVHCLSF